MREKCGICMRENVSSNLYVREREGMRASASEIESVRLTVSVIDTLFVRE